MPRRARDNAPRVKHSPYKVSSEEGNSITFYQSCPKYWYEGYTLMVQGVLPR